MLAGVHRALPELELIVNAHRSPVAIDHVRSGEYALALAAGVSEESPDLQAEILLEETMALVPSGLKPLTLTPGATLSVLTIEPGSATWGLLQRRLRRQSKQWGFTIEVSRTLQSFTSIVQMARHGFGHGLVPEGVARALGIRPRQLVHLPEPTLTRPVSLIGRPTSLSLPVVQHFYQALRQNLKA